MPDRLLAPRRVLAVVAACLAAALLAGCQLDVVVDVDVEEGGSGSVTVGVGLDDAALARAGDLERQLRVDDLAAAGWSVTPPVDEGDRTWVRATRAFADPEEAAVVLAELTGPEGPFRDFALDVDDGVFGTDYRLRGVVDLTGGPEAFGDEELAAALGGDPFGGTIQDIEQDEGRPIADMVDFQVAVSLPGTSDPEVFRAGFADAEPTEVDASSSTRSPVATAAVWVGVAAVGLVGLVLLRQAFRRTHR